MAGQRRLALLTCIARSNLSLLPTLRTGFVNNGPARVSCGFPYVVANLILAGSAYAAGLHCHVYGSPRRF